MMDCRTCQDLLEEYLDGTLVGAQNLAVEAHLAGCPACLAQLEAARRLEEGLCDRLLKIPPSDFTQRVVARIRVSRALPKDRGWITPILAYTGSLMAVLLGVAWVFGRGNWGTVREGAAGILREISLTTTRLDFDGSFRVGNAVQEALQTPAMVSQGFGDWLGSILSSLSAMQSPGLLLLITVVVMLLSIWPLYLLCSD